MTVFTDSTWSNVTESNTSEDHWDSSMRTLWLVFLAVFFGLLLLCTCQQMVLVSACMTSFPECWTFLSYLCMSSTAVHTVSSRFFVAKFGLHLRLHWLSLCLYSIDFFGWRHCNLSADNFQLFAHGLRCSTEIHACLQWKLWLLEQFSAFRVVSCPTNYTVSYYLTWQIACEVA